MGVMGDFGDRTMRAYAVGALLMLLMQEVLGSGRPSDTADNSYWRPFQHDNGVSGHMFVGAVPFITGSQHVGQYPGKGVLLRMFDAGRLVPDQRRRALPV